MASRPVARGGGSGAPTPDGAASRRAGSAGALSRSTLARGALSLATALLACSSEGAGDVPRFGGGGSAVGNAGAGGSGASGASGGASGAAAGGVDAAGGNAGSSTAGGSGSGGSMASNGGSAGSGSGGSDSGAGGAQAGAGGSDAMPPPPAGSPYAFTGSTDGLLRAFALDASDGSLSPAGSVDVGDDLDFVAVARDGRTAFASRNGSVAAYRYDPGGQSFQLVDEENTAGDGTHVAVDPTGTRVFVAHYNEGALTTFDYSDAGGFDDRQDLFPGQNAHQVTIDEAGAHVFVTCLGSNHVAQFNLDAVGDGFAPAATPTVAAAGGPRHMALHPDGTLAYVLAENSSQVHVFDVNAATGLLSARPADSVFTSEDGQYHWSSDVRVTPDGRFVYAVNRDPSEIVRFAVAADGSLTRETAQPLGGIVRAFAVDSAGSFVLIGGDDGNLVSYRIGADGSLAESARTSGLGNLHASVIVYVE